MGFLTCVIRVTTTLLVAAGFAFGQTPKALPRTLIDNFREVLHGVELVDTYRWLDDLESAEPRAWIDAQNAYTRSILDPLPSRRSIQKRLADLLVYDSMDAPEERGGRYFFSKRQVGPADNLLSPGPWRPGRGPD